MKTSVLSILMIVLFSCANAQQKKKEEIEAALIFTMLKYVQWPNENEPGDFVIGVMGDDEIYTSLKTYFDGRPKGSKKSQIRKLSSSAEFTSCSVVFLGKKGIKEFESIRDGIGSKSILLITDSPNYGQKGSHINFLEEDGKFKYELNMKPMDRSNLKVSNQLATLAILI